MARPIGLGSQNTYRSCLFMDEEESLPEEEDDYSEYSWDESDLLDINMCLCEKGHDSECACAYHDEHVHGLADEEVVDITGDADNICVMVKR